MTRRLDSRSLELFLAVAETLSFRQAAQMLHLSQPPLSRAIRELEERLGARLFERNTQAVRLTAAGRALVPYARRMAGLLAEARRAVADQADAVVALRLGMTNAVEPAWFRGLADRVRTACGGVPLTVRSDTSPRLVRQLRAGKLDAAFIALPTEARGLEVVELDRLRMMVAMPSSHPLARRRAVGLAQFAAQPLFWFERARQPAFHDHCQQVFARHGFSPPRVREPADHHVLLAEVAQGRALALLPESFAGLRRAGVSYRRLREGDELAVGIGLAMPAQADAPQPGWRALLTMAAAGR
ncbi:MAG: LysR family transcriptional regulator [Xenophilus sp.]